ncbi:PP2C family protein-serine/threonine phosphatase [Niveispirillum irakense]|uniref:PP2C family protein-serine/threonine phosphatase n=1 Tax=Niveispirillum irakense TaxID=34011 RepID=UPI00041846A3|nr:PP2C family protein-serine/threonine phosphatase [Niveispirillum irakense]
MRLGLGIRGKLLLLLFVASIATSASYTWFTYHRERNAVLAGIDARLLAAARAVELYTGVDYHDRIDGAGSVPLAQYQAMMQRLNTYARQTGFTYVYTYMQFDGNIRTTATNATEEELADGTYDRFFHHYDTASPVLFRAFQTGQIQFEDLVDSYGTFRTVFVPVTTPSGKVFVAGADLSIDFVEQQMRAALRGALLIGGAGFVLMMVLGHFVISRIIQPLTVLTGKTKLLVGDSIDRDIADQIRAIMARRRDEVGALAAALTEMIRRLDLYVIQLQETTAAKERVEGELSAAREIQLGLLPCREPPFPQHPEFELHGLMEPAKAVGGDLYDYFMVGEDHLVFIVGDVSGKGVPAALFMAVAKTLFKGNSASAPPPAPPDIASVVDLLNRQLCDENPQELFITVCAGILNIRTGQVDYCDGGHDAPIVLSADGQIKRVDKVPGLVLGAMDDYDYQAGRIMLSPGDTLLLYTDGITEAMDPTGRTFTYEGLLERLMAMPADLTPRGVNGWVRDSVAAFAEGAEQSDDLTLLTIRYLGDAQPSSVVESRESVFA